MLIKIDNINNDDIKIYKELREHAFRDDRSFIADSPKVVNLVLESELVVKSILATQEYYDEFDELLAKKNIAKKYVNALIKSCDDKELESFFETLKKLSKSFESQKFIKIPKYVISSIKVGEESGKLSVVLIEMAKFLKEEEKLLSKTTQALVYPLFIVMVSIFLVSFMLTTVVPKIVKVFENLNQKLPPITEFVINLSNF